MAGAVLVKLLVAALAAAAAEAAAEVEVVVVDVEAAEVAAVLEEAVVAAAAECEGLKKPLAKDHLHKIFGDWVLVWAVTDDPNWNFYPVSSHVELRLHDNETIVFNERNLMDDKSCNIYILNFSESAAPSERHALSPGPATLEQGGVVQPYNDTGDLDLYQSDAHSLVVMYTNTAGRFLMIYREEGHHSDVEQLKSSRAEHERRAKCFGFPDTRRFLYDGAADFCHKKSSVEVKAEEA